MAETGTYASNLLKAWEFVAKHRHGITAGEIATHVGVEDETARRYMRALQIAGWVVDDSHINTRYGPVKRWRVSPEIIRVLWDTHHDVFDSMTSAKDENAHGRGVRL